MITKPVLRFAMCYGLYILFQTVTPKVLGIRRVSDMKQYMDEGQRARGRRNYIDQMSIEHELFENFDDLEPRYGIRPVEAEIPEEELPALIVDYADKIRNDMFLLDNSLETRAHKRGNSKPSKHQQGATTSQCSCELNRYEIDLGTDYFPRIVVNRSCSEQMCSDFYTCQSNMYELTVLKKRSSLDKSDLKLPMGLGSRWVAEVKPITVGCVCTKFFK